MLMVFTGHANCNECRAVGSVDLGESKAISEIRLHPCSDDFGGIGNGFGFPVRFKLEASDNQSGIIHPSG